MIHTLNNPQPPLPAQALTSATNAIFITDETGKIVWVNDAFTRLSGYTAEEAIGRTPAILQSGKQDQAFYADLWKTIHAGKVWQGEVVDQRKDGSTYTVDEVITPLFNEQDVITHFISIQHDITAHNLTFPQESHMSEPAIQPHNLRAAAVWDSAGSSYDKISQSVSDAIEHCVMRLQPQTGERILDIATGTGWAARRVAARGAQVTGIDLGSELIEAAKAYAADAHLDIDFQIADAEALSFENKTFDAAISTFGIMFASRPEAAANELARICKPGGRIGLATWPPDGTIAGFFKVMKSYTATPPSPPPPSPFEWGTRERQQQLLGPSFDLRFETGTTVLRERSGESVWELFLSSYGPTKMLASTLEPERLDNLKQDFIAYHEQFRTELGIAMPRDYLITIGIRK